MAELIATIFADRTARILDVGCGQGELIKRLRAIGYINVEGCDLLPENQLVDGGQYSFCQVDLNRDGLTVYGSRKFDLVISSDVLEHLENPGMILREFSRLLNAGGRVVISLPNAFNIFERMSWLLHGNSTRYKTEAPGDFGHISLLPSNIIKSLVARANLRVVRASGGYAYVDGYFIRPGASMSTKLSYNIFWVFEPETS